MLVILLIFLLSQVQSMFQSKKHRRFLMHLIGHHLQINLRQAYSASKPIEDDDGRVHLRKLYSQVGLLLGFIKHSCSPNVFPIDRDGDTVFAVVRPIQAGEELFINYYGFHWDMKGENGYRENVSNCRCERCEGRMPSNVEIEQLTSDPDFRFMCYYHRSLDEEIIDAKIFDALKKRCIRLLSNHGRMVWCTDFSFAFCLYTKVLTAEYSGTIQVSHSTDTLNNNS